MSGLRLAAMAAAIIFAAAMAAIPTAVRSQTAAATIEIVSMGAGGVVARDPAIVVTAEPKRGSAAKVADPASPGRELLLYYAPSAERDYDDELRYTTGGTEKTVRIAVRSAPTLASGAIYAESFKALFTLFVLAVLVESALALLFRWRPYLDYVNSRGLNALIAFGVSMVLVSAFSLDITTTLMNLYTGANFASGLMGQILTAAVIAGGSAGVNTLLRALGFREIVQPEAETAKPPANRAWLAVIHKRGDADGPVNVVIVEGDKKTVARTIPPSIGGGWFARNFRRDRGRFPPSGGHTLTPSIGGATPTTGPEYKVFLEGFAMSGGERRKVRSEIWGPHSVAAGAIIDLELVPRFVDEDESKRLPDPQTPGAA
jgi:hypothetical protein